MKKLHEYYYSSRILTGPRRAESPISGIEARDRILASCMGMGQAAGVTAALAATQRRDPRDIPIDLIKKRLTDIGHIVP